MYRLRDLLAERQLDVAKTVCVGAFDDYLDKYMGVLVLPDGQAIEFSLDFSETPKRQAKLSHWGPVAKDYYVERIEAGRELLGRERA